jgi:hypothetical protein
VNIHPKIQPPPFLRSPDPFSGGFHDEHRPLLIARTSNAHRTPKVSR